jgi:DNA transformation protein and related proteins
MATKRALDDEFHDYCLELLSSMRQGEIATKKMFGGRAFSIDGKTFGIIAFDQLWLKADELSIAEFKSAGCPIFTYQWKDGIDRHLGYYAPPPEAMESAALMRPWAMLGWQAALRAAAAKSQKAASKTKKPVANTAGKTAVNAAAKQSAKSRAC